MIEDHEARVERERTSERVDLDGVRVAARIIVRLEQVHLVLAVQQSGGEHSTDSATDHRDLHDDSPPTNTLVGSSLTLCPAVAPVSWEGL